MYDWGCNELFKNIQNRQETRLNTIERLLGHISDDVYKEIFKLSTAYLKSSSIVSQERHGI